MTTGALSCDGAPFRRHKTKRRPKDRDEEQKFSLFLVLAHIVKGGHVVYNEKKSNSSNISWTKG